MTNALTKAAVRTPLILFMGQALASPESCDATAFVVLRLTF
jgi:hypothetical protein